MKKALFKDTLIEIRKTKTRFLAIFAIVALGVGIFSGIGATADDMRYTADKYFDRYHLFDIHMLSSLGITQDDVVAFSKLDEVEDVFPTFSKEVLIQKNNQEKVFRIEGYDFNKNQNINAFKLIKGHLPSNDGECLIENSDKIKQFEEFVEVGDNVEFSLPKNEDIKNTFKKATCKVVGTVTSPYYLSYQKGSANIGNGQLASYIYVDQKIFNLEVYTDLYIRVKDADSLNTYSDEYQKLINKTIDDFKIITKERAKIRKDDIYNQANKKYQEGLATYQKNQAIFNQEITDAEIKLKNAKKDYDDGYQKYLYEKAQANQKLDEAKYVIDDGYRQLKTHKHEIHQQLPGIINKLNNSLSEMTAQKNNLDASMMIMESSALNTKAIIQHKQDYLKSTLNKLLEIITKSFNGPINDDELNEYNHYKQNYLDVYDELNQLLNSDDFDNLINYKKTVVISNNLDKLMTELKNTIALFENVKNNSWDNQKLINAIDNFNETYDNTKNMVDEYQQVLSAGNTELLTFENESKTLVEWIAYREDLFKNVPVPINELFAIIADDLNGADKNIVGEKLREVNAINKRIDDLEHHDNYLKYNLAFSNIEVEKNKLNFYHHQKVEQLYLPISSLIEINANELKINTQAQQLNAKKVSVNTHFEAIKKDLDLGLTTLNDNYITYDQNKLDGEYQLKDAYNKLVDAKNKLDNIKDGKWYILGRDKHYSYVDYRGTCDRMEAIAKVFPAFFFLVSALVCLTTMTRLVDEKRLEIGTLKALGYRKGQIIFKYLFYAGSASLLGGLIGAILGIHIFPYIIYNTWKMLYDMPDISFVFQGKLLVFSISISMLITVIATIFACAKTLKDNPAQLIRPKTPKLGKKILLERIAFIWKPLSFISKITVRNLFRYKKRFFMTVVGIAGCTALLVAGFGIHNSISTIVNAQFYEIFNYHGEVDIDTDYQSYQEIIKVIDNHKLIDNNYGIYKKSGKVIKGNFEKDAYLEVFDHYRNFSNLINLHHRTDKQQCIFDEDGAVISEKMAIDLKINKGDLINFNIDNHNYQIKVLDIAENYLHHYIYMPQEYYQKVFDKHLVNNTVIFRMKEASADNQSKITADLMMLKDVNGISYNLWIRDNFNQMISGLSSIVAILVVSAALLAFVVLINLTNVNISERIREIATLKVLGFRYKEVNAYINRENLILSIIGGMLGLFLGKSLHYIIMIVVELDNIMFGREIKLISYFSAFLLTILFTIIVGLIMNRRLKKIEMIESLKSIE